MSLTRIPCQYVEKLRSRNYKYIVWTNEKKRNWQVGQGFFKTSNYIRVTFWKSIEHIYIYM